MSKLFFPLRLETVKDLAIAVQELARRFNILSADQEKIASTPAPTPTGDTTSIVEASSISHGLAPQSPGDPTKFLNGDHAPAYAFVKDSDLSLSDIVSNNVTSTGHGFAPKSPANAAVFLNGDTTPGYAAVKDSDLAITDIATNNVSIAQHGFAPKAPNDATKYLDGTGAYSVPAGSGGAIPAYPTISNWEFGIDTVLSAITAVDGRLSQINDISGNARHATNGSTAGKPRYLPACFNGKFPGLILDGTANKHLIVTLPNLPAPLSFIIVLQDLSIGTGDGNLYRDQTTNRCVGYLQGGNSWSIFADTTGFQSTTLWDQNKSALPASMTGAPAVRIDIYNNASSLICNNATEISGSAASATNLTNGVFNIGDGVTPVSTAAKYILRAFHVYSKALSLAERNSIRTYFANPLVAGVQI